MAKGYKLSQNDLKMIQNKLFMYKRIDNAIAIRKQELKMKENRDENFGGGRSNKISKPVEELVMKWDADPQIQNFNNFRNLVDEMLTELDDLNRLIFHYRWIDSNRYTWEEIAEKCFISERTVRRKRRVILELYDEKSGGIW